MSNEPKEGEKRIYVRVSTNIIGSQCSDYFDIAIDATEEEINTEAKEVMFNMIEWNWSEDER